jgi:hypothetical protein
MLPGWIQRFAAFLPATYLVSSFQAIMVGGQSLFEHKAEMLVLFTSGTFGLLFAWKLFRWEEEEKISSRAKLVSLTFIVPFLVMGIWMNEYGNLAKTWEETYSLTSHAPLAAGRHASPADSVLLNNFESPEEPEILLKTWQVTTDASAAGRSLGEFEVISPGAAGTEHALRFQGRVESAPGAHQGFVTAGTHSRSPRALRAGAGFSWKCAAIPGFSRSKSRHPISPCLPPPSLLSLTPNGKAFACRRHGLPLPVLPLTKIP